MSFEKLKRQDGTWRDDNQLLHHHTSLITHHSSRGPKCSSLIQHDFSLDTQCSTLNSQHFLELSADLLQRGHSVRFRAPGKSMQPTIFDGEVIIVNPVIPSQVREGDIILYRSRIGLVAHRVISIYREKGAATRSASPRLHHPLLDAQPSSLSPRYSFILRGDASGTFDGPVASGQILGKVACVERGGRRIDLDGRWARMSSKARVYASRLKSKLIQVFRHFGNG